MTTSTGVPAPGAAGTDAPVWHTLTADRALQAEEVDEQSGLSSAEAAARIERFGPNKFDAGEAEPRSVWSPVFPPRRADPVPTAPPVMAPAWHHR